MCVYVCVHICVCMSLFMRIIYKSAAKRLYVTVYNKLNIYTDVLFILVHCLQIAVRFSSNLYI